MPENTVCDFSLTANPDDAYVDPIWGRYEVVLNLHHANGHYGENGRPWLYMSRTVAKNLHRALGAYLSKEARGA